MSTCGNNTDVANTPTLQGLIDWFSELQNFPSGIGKNEFLSGSGYFMQFPAKKKVYMNWPFHLPDGWGSPKNQILFQIWTFHAVSNNWLNFFFLEIPYNVLLHTEKFIFLWTLMHQVVEGKDTIKIFAEID